MTIIEEIPDSREERPICEVGGSRFPIGAATTAETAKIMICANIETRWWRVLGISLVLDLDVDESNGVAMEVDSRDNGDRLCGGLIWLLSSTDLTCLDLYI